MRPLVASEYGSDVALLPDRHVIMPKQVCEQLDIESKQKLILLLSPRAAREILARGQATDRR